MRTHPMVPTALLGLCLAGAAAADEPTQAPVPAAPAHVAVLSGDQVVQILDETVEWYRTLGTQQQTASQPSDLLILYANQQTASRVIGLAFDIARANAELLSSEASNAPATPDAASSAQALDGLQKKLQAQRQAVQSEMDSVRRQIAASQEGANAELGMELSVLQSAVDMFDARKNLLDTMAQFMNESDSKTANANALKAHIDAIAMSVPAAGTAPAASPTASSPAKSAAAAPTTLVAGSSSSSSRSGIWDLAANVLRLSGKVRTISAIDRRTAALEQ